MGKGNKKKGKRKGGNAPSSPGKHNQNYPGKQYGGATSNTVITKEKKQIEEARGLHSEAASKASESEKEKAKESVKGAQSISLEEANELARKAQVLFKMQEEKLKEAEKEANRIADQANTLLESLEEREGDLKEKEEELLKRIKKIERKSGELESQEKELIRRTEELIGRELDADKGFIKRNREALAELDREAEELRKWCAGLRKEMAEERKACDEELEERRIIIEDELSQKKKQLEETFNERRDGLEKREKEIRKSEEDIKLERELLEEERNSLSERVAKFAARELEERDTEIVALKERLDEARKYRDLLSSQLAAREEADRRFGEMAPDDLLRELETLRENSRKLEEELGRRPDAKMAQRFEDLKQQQEIWEEERLRLIRENSELKNDLSSKLIAVTEVERLRDYKRALETSKDLLAKALEDKNREYEELIKGTDGASSFKLCSDMDNDRDLQSARETLESIDSLREFAIEVRNRIANAYAKDEGVTLFYTEEDIRSFIGGVAMSRLHLLQGISGTGKTSLPRAFARAIGAGKAIVPVQAGWRDREDLIGHYNTFEKRFHEEIFLEALYKANCPKYRDTPFIIVLDEMNLSHPEQYFADILSLLEINESEQLLELVTAPVDSPPALFKEGRKLALPPNVWFIGTANHDETTKDFAEKTYSRAYVMELPNDYEQFKVEEQLPKKPVSLKALTNAFHMAREINGKASDQAFEFLHENLKETLNTRFRIGWGNRLKSQMEAYVPVVIESGGTIGEATDYILCTKLLRGIRDRHDTRPEDVETLKNILETKWAKLDKKRGPEKSLGLIRDELHRLGKDEV